MSYPQITDHLRPAGGLVLDLPPNSVGNNFYTGGQNVLFRNGFAGRIPGYRIAYPVDDGALPIETYHTLNVQFAGLNYWILLGLDSIYAVEGSNVHDLTPVGGLTPVTSPEDWSHGILNGIPIVSNGREPPLYWAGDVGDPFEALPDWPAATIARSIAVLKYHIFAFDIDGPSGDFGSLVMWSDAAEPGTVPASWTPGPSNDAGSAPLADTDGRIMCGAKQAGSMLIYKPNGIYQASYTGAASEFNQEVFAVPLKFSEVGAWTRRAVADCDDFHIAVTDGDIVRVTTTNVVSAADARTRNILQSSIDPDNYRNLFVVRDRAKREVWVCYPESGSTYCNKALVWDQRKDTWGVRDLDQVKHAASGLVSDETVSEAWDDDSEAWDDDHSIWNTSAGISTQSRFVTVQGDTMIVHDTSDNVAVNAMVAKYDMDFGSPERIKACKAAVIGASNYNQLSVRLGVRNSLAETDGITWTTPHILTSPESIVDRLVEGRYLSIEVSSVDDRVWQLSYIGLEIEPRGYF